MTVIASAIVRDPLGRPYIHTKAAELPSANGVPPLAFRADAVTQVDPRTLRISGAIASALAQDDGYPYRGQGYESSPLSRVVAEGLPGSDFAIVPGADDAHPRRYGYTSNDAVGDVPAGAMHATISSVTNASGGPPASDFAQTTISSDFDGTIGHVETEDDGTAISPPRMGFSRVDPLGNARTLLPPSYFDPPSGDGDAYRHELTSSFLGEVTSWTTPDTGQTRYVLDPAGRLRFAQSAAGVEQGWFAYVRYDALGRVLEHGVIDEPCDEPTLQRYADTAPGWPQTPPTWIHQIEYDGDGDGEAPFALGHVSAVKTN